MQFRQLDEILEVVPRERLRARLVLNGDESYLGDHFPKFRVMPGVLMLEAMFQAATWLIRVSDDFAHPIITMHEVRNAKFGAFLEPGDSMEIMAEIAKWEDDLISVRAQGSKDGSVGVSVRMTLKMAAHCIDDTNSKAWGGYYANMIRNQWQSLLEGPRKLGQTAV